MLEKSNDSLPYSLVLLENEEVLGHSRLCKVHGVEKACFVESGEFCCVDLLSFCA